MNILLTGSEGFIASHVRARLGGHEVVGLDILEPRVHGDLPDDIFINARSAGDVTTAELFEADIIIHLGAQVGVADSMTDPLRYVMDNTWDTALFLKILADSGARPKRLVVASSMSIYGDPQTSTQISETHPVRPASVYGLTKYDQERLCLMYGELLDIPTAALRFFNVYGPGQALTNPYTGVLAIFAGAWMRGETPTVYEDGLQTRDFIYVEDVADAVVRMALESTATGVFNVCTGRARTVLGCSHALSEGILGGCRLPNITHTSRPGDIRHCVGDNSKLKAALPGWEPRAFEEGIGLYIEDLLK